VKFMGLNYDKSTIYRFYDQQIDVEGDDGCYYGLRRNIWPAELIIRYQSVPEKKHTIVGKISGDEIVPLEPYDLPIYATPQEYQEHAAENYAKLKEWARRVGFKVID
jgi:hypothetical protein